MASGDYSVQELVDLLFNATTYDGMTQTNNNCAVLYHEKYSDISTTLGVAAAAVSLAACTVVTMIICVLKKHHFLSQRLILYLALAVLLRCLSWIPQRVHVDLIKENRRGGDTTVELCSIAGYLSLTTGWFELLAVASLTTNQILQMVMTTPRRWLELAYILTTFLVPFAFTWIPFVDGVYGQAGEWCWIRQQTNDCQNYTLGISLGYLLWFAPLFLILLLLLILYCRVVYRVSKRNTAWDGNFNPMLRKMKMKAQKEVRPLILYPLVYFLLYLVPLTSRIADSVSSEPVYVLWILSAIVQGLQGGFIALAFTLDIRTVRRLRRQNITATVRGIRETILVEDYRSEHKAEKQPYTAGFLSDEGEEEGEDNDEDDGNSRVITARYTEYN